MNEELRVEPRMDRNRISRKEAQKAQERFMNEGDMRQEGAR